MSRGFFNFQKNFTVSAECCNLRFPFGSGLCNFAKNHTEKRKQVNRRSESRRKIKGTETRPFLKTLSFCKTITEASFAFFLNKNKNRDEKSSLFSFCKVRSSQINKASFAFSLNQNKSRDEKSSLFSFCKVHSSQINKASFAFSLNQNKSRDEKSSLFSFCKVHSSQINKASFAFFSSRRKEGQFCF